MNKQILYFGCIRNAGHYLWQNEIDWCNEAIASRMPGVRRNLLQSIDGLFCPEVENECIYRVSSIPPLTIISWWDRSIDKRMGSNSNIIAYGYKTVEEIFHDAKIQFPSVFNRQNKELKPE